MNHAGADLPAIEIPGPLAEVLRLLDAIVAGAPLVAAELQLTLGLSEVDTGFLAWTPELAVLAEGSSAEEARDALVRSTGRWLEHVRAEGDADDLDEALPYVALLDVPGDAWFGRVILVD